MTANQVVAYNMAKARALRGWTQERVGEELAPYLGVKLSLKSGSIDVDVGAPGAGCGSGGVPARGATAG
jgi:hypothetical protein